MGSHGGPWEPRRPTPDPLILDSRSPTPAPPSAMPTDSETRQLALGHRPSHDSHRGSGGCLRNVGLMKRGAVARNSAIAEMPGAKRAIGFGLKASDEQEVNHLMGAIGHPDRDGSPGRRLRKELRMVHAVLLAVGHINLKWLTWLRPDASFGVVRLSYKNSKSGHHNSKLL